MTAPDGLSRPEKESEPKRAGRAQRGEITVLIVDDEEPLTEILSFVVLDAGYHPITAPHGRRALELVRDVWPDLVITDLMMPYLNGAALIAALRLEATHRGVPMIPAVLITGAGWDAAQQAGADVVIHKPFEITAIDALIQQFLGDRRP